MVIISHILEYSGFYGQAPRSGTNAARFMVYLTARSVAQAA
jgi:hypothetical protein